MSEKKGALHAKAHGTMTHVGATRFFLDETWKAGNFILQGTNISHHVKRKPIFKGSLERAMLVPRSKGWNFLTFEGNESQRKNQNPDWAD